VRGVRSLMVIVKAKEQVNFDQFSNNTSEK
jgi:hypothetical protein